MSYRMKGVPVTRRHFLYASGALAAIGCRGDAIDDRAPVESVVTRTFVLVHGAWHGGWCWRDVATRLRAHGHRVSTPTLTGLGERAHLYHKDIDLDLHTQDVVAHIEMEDLRDVVLVGHSYGGMVITGVLAILTERIASMVYLDAFLPEDGKSLVDYLPESARAGLNLSGEGFQPFSLESFGVTDPTVASWANERLRNQPAKTVTQPVKALPVRPDGIPHTYIRAAGYEANAFDEAAERAKIDSSWTYTDIPYGHDVMLIAPEALTELLLSVA